MTLKNLHKAPFPYFGGKTAAAPTIWAALGDVAHYAEPFMGSLATLILRPHTANRCYHSETANDLDGMLVNFWRSIQSHPRETADAASWPVSEIDLMARHMALVRWANDGARERLVADPAYCDPQMAGWWCWGQSSWIGSGWCSGRGPWVVTADGRVVKQGRAPRGSREPGVNSQRPHLGNNGQGVNHAGTREPGVNSQRPHLSADGQGVNRPQSREPGVRSQRPHLGNNGQGVNHAGTREPGVDSKRPHISDDGQGVNHAGTREPGVSDDETAFHPMTMPEVRRWFEFLSARLRHVRIISGDWSRAVTTGATLTLGIRGGGPKKCGVFLDPPYADSADRVDGLYAHDSLSVAHAVREWCLAHGADDRYRIVLAGFQGEHGSELTDAGWREVEWFAGGWLSGGMGNTSKTGKHQQKRERLWLSPHCLREPDVADDPEPAASVSVQRTMF